MSSLLTELERLNFMMQQHLQYRARTAPPFLSGRHLDEDMLAVFVEGRLSERESAPMVTHLVGCSACRHNTAQLIRLADELAPETPFAVAEAMPEPNVFQRFFNGLRERARQLAPEPDAVFAYQESETETAQEPRDEPIN